MPARKRGRPRLELPSSWDDCALGGRDWEVLVRHHAALEAEVQGRQRDGEQQRGEVANESFLRIMAEHGLTYTPAAARQARRRMRAVDPAFDAIVESRLRDQDQERQFCECLEDASDQVLLAGDLERYRGRGRPVWGSGWSGLPDYLPYAPDVPDSTLRADAIRDRVALAFDWLIIWDTCPEYRGTVLPLEGGRGRRLLRLICERAPHSDADRVPYFEVIDSFCSSERRCAPGLWPETYKKSRRS